MKLGMDDSEYLFPSATSALHNSLTSFSFPSHQSLFSFAHRSTSALTRYTMAESYKDIEGPVTMLATVHKRFLSFSVKVSNVNELFSGKQFVVKPEIVDEFAELMRAHVDRIQSGKGFSLSIEIVRQENVFVIWEK